MWIVRNIPMRAKLISLLFLISLVAVIAATAVSLFISQRIVRDAATERLISVRADRAAEIEHLFAVLRDELTLMAQDQTILEAMSSFTTGFNELSSRGGELISAETIETYYEQEFLPSLEVNLRRELDPSEYVPQTIAGRYLQNGYIIENENPIGSKHLLDQVDDGSAYSATHLQYHPFLRAFIDLFDYYDLFLIDVENRNVVYSVFKEVDFATSLSNGPYADSGLAEVVDQVLNDPKPGEIYAVDFSPYDPSYQAPASFFATPLYQGDALLGVMVIQMPIDEINHVMTGDMQWVERGMGETGETYLIGPDFLMRSVSRLLIEDRTAYSGILRQAGVEPATVDRIINLGTSILLQEVATDSAQLALQGDTGIHIIDSADGGTLLSAYAPLMIEGLDWAIIAELNEAEINAPLIAQQQFFLMIIGGVLLGLLLFSIFMASRFTRPARELAKMVDAAGTSDAIVLPEKFLNANDEIGRLSTALTDNLTLVAEQQALVDEVSRENKRLMLSILPAPIAARLKNGEHNIAEEIENVTLMFANVSGIHELTMRVNNRKKTAEMLNILTGRLENSADTFDVQRDPTVSNRFMAVCGLNNEEGDRVERMVRYAIHALRILREFNEEFGSNLGFNIGIHNGEVLAAVLETDAFRFELWGAAVEITNSIELAAARNTILVSHEVYQKVEHLFAFEAADPVKLENERVWRAWQLIPPVDDEEEDSIGDRFAYALSQATRNQKLPSSLKPRARRTRKRFVRS